MAVGRVLIGLVTTLIVEGSGIYAPLLKLNVFWTTELTLLRYVILGTVLCGLAVTGGAPPPVEAKPEKKILRRRDAPPEKDPGLEAMAAAFREKLEKPVDSVERFNEAVAIINREEEPMKTVEEGVDFVKLQEEISKAEEEKPAEGG